jgi:hypothetical protein
VVAEIVVPAPIGDANMPMAWSSLIGSAPQPGISHTPPVTVLPVTRAVTPPTMKIDTCSAGTGRLREMMTLSVNVTELGATRGPTAYSATSW